MFTLLCCADLYGEKVNLEITWDTPIYTLADLEARLVAAFSQEKEACRPQHTGPMDATGFTAARIQIYDDELLCWADLASLAQLHEFDQLYVFQPQTPWQRDTQQDLPPPRPPSGRRPYSSHYCGADTAAAGAASVTVTPNSVQADGRYPIREGDAIVHAYRGGPSAEGTYCVPPVVHQPPSSSAPVLRPATVSADAIGYAYPHPLVEESLVEKLSRLRAERAALERAAMDDAENERRLRAAEADRCLREKENDIWRQRDALRRAEQEFQRLLQEKQRLIGLQ